MLPPRACAYLAVHAEVILLTHFVDIFIGLNAARVLSVIAMLLVFSSSIEVMVTNIKAVNYYEAHKGDNNATMSAMNMDYIAGSTVPSQPAGIFWAIVSSLLIIFQTVTLICACFLQLPLLSLFSLYHTTYSIRVQLANILL
ncbi:hypothetical protein GGU10DRAFT_280209 [Lentinula aff. detonsa]|uniref:Uncharacterized protein n=1 Tax=Lentinula aff. detonsa TaxID=2804958 RepID=A0AA38KML7_9AGAR|nr:hypothetical protein GGU10DRAFT_280209 [Lentinula aff. detonsa]